MKIDATGVHIENIQSLVIQNSNSQNNAIAFLTNEGLWVHIDINLIEALHNGIVGQQKQSPFVGE